MSPGGGLTKMFGTTTYMNMPKGTVSQYHLKPIHLDKTGQKS